MEFNYVYNTDLNNWHNGDTLVPFKLAKLRSDKPFFVVQTDRD